MVWGVVKIMTGKPIETADMSLWELVDSEHGNRHRNYLDPLHVGDSCIAWSFVSHLG